MLPRRPRPLDGEAPIGRLPRAAYLDVPPERWDWVRERYASLSPDPGLAERISSHVTLLYASWATRLGRMLYEIPRGQDVRLAPWPDCWLTTVQTNYERYLERAPRVVGDRSGATRKS